MIERVPVNVNCESMTDVRFVYNVHLLSTFTFHNYLPYPIRLAVSRVDVSLKKFDTNIINKQLKVLADVERVKWATDKMAQSWKYSLVRQ